MKTYWLIRVGITISFLVLLTFILQINLVKGGYYKKLARNNKMTEELVLAKRGKIFDTKGRLIVESLDVDGVFGTFLFFAKISFFFSFFFFLLSTELPT
jgi:cell division protein FtsI/penicillin-binding protein 2